jgi:hypothetical protein
VGTLLGGALLALALLPVVARTQGIRPGKIDLAVLAFLTPGLPGQGA